MKKLFLMIALMLPTAAMAQGYDVRGKNILTDVTTLTAGNVDSNNYVLVYDVTNTNNGSGDAVKYPLEQIVGDVETLTAASSLTSADCGTTKLLQASSEFVTTLPAPVDNCSIRLIVASAPSGANYKVVTDALAKIQMGNLINASGTTTTTILNVATGATFSFVSSLAKKGDKVEYISNGTNWFVTGIGSAKGAITMN